MHVQRVVVPGNQAESWTVLDDGGRVVKPVERWLAHLTAIGRSLNTVQAYSHDLKDYLVFLASRGLDWREVRLEDIGAFVAWLRLPAGGRDGSVAVLPGVAPEVTGSTVNRKLSAVNAFYCFHARRGVDAGELLVTWQAPGRGGRGGYRPFLHHQGLPAAAAHGGVEGRQEAAADPGTRRGAGGAGRVRASAGPLPVCLALRLRLPDWRGAGASP